MWTTCRITIFEEVVALSWTDALYIEIHVHVSLQLMFEMVAGFKDTRVAGLDLMCVVAVTGIVGEISQGFAKLDTSRDDVHTGSCIRKHEHN